MIETWGHAPDGSPVVCATISSGRLTASVLSYGATLQDLRMSGHDFPLVLSYPDLGPYLRNPYYFGAVVGRYANRIAHGKCRLGTHNLTLETGGNAHQLHGGPDGLSYQNWTLADHGPDYVEFRQTLPDGHMGYPGALAVSARFSLKDDALDLVLQAEADAETLCNLTLHPYFHLDGTNDLGGHQLQINAAEYCKVDQQGIPTGALLKTSGSSFDFARSMPLLRNGGLKKIDHNFCLSHSRRPLADACTLTSKHSGLQLTVATTEPGVQIYTFENDAPPEKVSTKTQSGVAIEPQIWPDAPNQPSFPSAVLRPGETYLHHIRYAISNRAD